MMNTEDLNERIERLEELVSQARFLYNRDQNHTRYRRLKVLVQEYNTAESDRYDMTIRQPGYWNAGYPSV